jgi:hypothetical protein
MALEFFMACEECWAVRPDAALGDSRLSLLTQC